MDILSGGEKGRVENRLLLALPAASLKRLQPHMEWVDLTAGSPVHQAGAPVRRLLFINRGFVSIVKAMQDGGAVEIGTKGRSDAIGIFALHGVEYASWDTLVQISGDAVRVNCDVLRSEFESDPQVRALLQRYTRHVLGGMAQTAACHRLHALRQRFCRWLLAAQDATGSNVIAMTHETLALMLGVQRSGVSIIASAFQKAGVLRSGRGSLTILDRGALEAEACECYASELAAFGKVLAAAAPTHG